MNKYKTLLSNTVIFAIGTFSSKILVFLLMPIYTRALSPADYGVVDLIVNTANLLIPIVCVSIFDSVIRFGIDKSNRKSDVFSTGIVTVLLGFCIFLLFIPLMKMINLIANYTILIYLYVLCSMLKSVCAQFVRARGMIKLYALDGILSTVMVIIFNILGLLVFKWGIVGFVLATILSDLCSSIFLFVVANMGKYLHPFHIQWPTAKAMLLYSIPLIPNTLFWWITNLSDRYIVSYMLGTDINGLYSVAYKIPTVITAVSTIFIQAWQISAFTEHNSKEKAKFYSKVLKSYQSIVFIIASLIILFAKVISKILVSANFYSSWKYVPILILSVVFSTFVNFYASLYMAEKKSVYIMVTTVTGAIINIGLNFTLIPIFGANGAAFATFASYFVVYLIRTHNIKKMIPLKTYNSFVGTNVVLLGTQIAIILSEMHFWWVAELLLCVAVVMLNFNRVLKMLPKNLLKTFKK